MKRLVLVAALAAALLQVGCSPDASKANASLRVGSYNIRLSAGDLDTPNAWTNRQHDLVVQTPSIGGNQPCRWHRVARRKRRRAAAIACFPQ